MFPPIPREMIEPKDVEWASAEDIGPLLEN